MWISRGKVTEKQNKEKRRKCGDAASTAFSVSNKSSIICSDDQDAEGSVRCSLLIILGLSQHPSGRTKPNRKGILSKGIPLSETELPESKLCKVASTKLQEALPYLRRQVFKSP